MIELPCSVCGRGSTDDNPVDVYMSKYSRGASIFRHDQCVEKPPALMIQREQYLRALRISRGENPDALS